MNKEKIRCALMIGAWRIEGEVHVLADSRLTDALNSKANDFLAVTDAAVFDGASGEKLYEREYVTVNRSSIVFAFPLG